MKYILIILLFASCTVPEHQAPEKSLTYDPNEEFLLMNEPDAVQVSDTIQSLILNKTSVK